MDVKTQEGITLRCNIGYYVIKPAIYDVGITLPSMEYSGALPFPNPVDEDIYINSIKTSCGCIRSRIEDFELPRGGKLNLEFALMTNPTPGRMNEQVFLFGSSASGEVVLSANISTEVRSPLRGSIFSQGIDFGSVGESVGSAHAVQFELERGDHPLRWDRLTLASKHGWFEPRLEIVDEGKWRVECIPLCLQGFLGVQKDDLLLQLRQEDERIEYEMALPVKLDCIGPISWNPRSILAGRLRANVETGFSFLIESKDRSTQSQGWLEIVSVEFEDGSEADWTFRDRSEESVVIELSFTPTGAGPFDKFLSIRALLGESLYEFRIPCAGLVIDEDSKIEED